MIDATAVYEAALTGRRTLYGDPHYPALRAVADAAANDAIERCAKVCEDEFKNSSNDPPSYRQNTISYGCLACAAAIRELKG